jgi:hypothetical protein
VDQDGDVLRLKADLDVAVGEALVAAALADRADEVDADCDAVIGTDLAKRQGLTESLLAALLGRKQALLACGEQPKT